MMDSPDVSPVEPLLTEEPAAAVAVSRRRRVTVVLYTVMVIAAWVGLELWGLGRAPFDTKGEPREGLVVWQLTHEGSWILPRRAGPTGIEVPSKPPLFHWLGAMTSLVRGSTDEWSIRFPSAALSLISLLCVFAAGTALWSPRAGLFSALALMTMFEWARAATGARVDMTLTFGLQIAFLSLLFFLRSRAPGWLVPLYLGMALAVLGKGPVGVALPGLVALVMLGLTRDTSFLRQMRLGYGALVVGVLAGSWYAMALIVGGWQFFYKQILAENVFTFLDSQKFGGGHRHTVFYMLGALLLGLMPWTICLPGLAGRLWRNRRQLTLSDARVYLLVWTAVVFAFYALAASKRSVYLLSLYPAVALLLGWWADEQSRAPADEDRWLGYVIRWVSWSLAGLLAVLFVIVLLESLGLPLCMSVQRWLPRSAQRYAPWISETVRSGHWPLMGLLLIAAAWPYAAVRPAASPGWVARLAGLWGATAAITVSVNLVILPGIAQHESFRSLMVQVRQVLGPERDLCFFNTFEYGAVFYWQDHIPSCGEKWQAGAPRYQLMDKNEWENIRPSVRGQYEQITFADGTAADTRLVLVRRMGE